MRELAQRAIERLEDLGAEYGDVRLETTNTEYLAFRNGRPREASLQNTEGLGVRAIVGGRWGFASCSGLSASETDSVVKRAVDVARSGARVSGPSVDLCPLEPQEGHYDGPYRQDPFEVPRERKLDLLTRAAENLHAPSEVTMSYASLWFERNNRIFASTEGSLVSSTLIFSYPFLHANAVDRGDAQSRNLHCGARVAGFEWIEDMGIPGLAGRIAEEAVMKVKAEEGPTGTMDLILGGTNLSLTMHESVGHPTESDRAVGWEANMAGRTFLSISDQGNFRYGSPLVNLLADNTIPYGLASWGWDDDGVPGQKWHVVKEGVFQEFGSVRETAALIGRKSSRGCCRAQDFSHFQINRQPNLYMVPSSEPVSEDDLISDTKHGIYIEGRGSYSIDQRRLNFQFGGDFFWEIRNGKKVRPLKKVIYRSTTPDFWRSCDGVADERSFRTMGLLTCGKGEPVQAARMTHGSSTARFRGIEVRGGR
ncbi:TldD/PmbA family protein [Candidatus Fermentibacteria bacterium]|nr:TldD/PmbA family protein [Candidatus Fermentibacteria bacterium]